MLIREKCRNWIDDSKGRFSTTSNFWLEISQRAIKLLLIVCAVIGVALVVAWCLIHKPDALILLALAWVVGAAVFFIVLSVIMDCAILVRQRKRSPGRKAIDPDRPIEAMSSGASGVVRQEILLRRLDVDESRHCSQSQRACSMWSFCGSIDDEENCIEANETLARPREVQRNVANCPYPKAEPIHLQSGD